MSSVLGYWDIRGFGQAIRLLLKYVGEDFEDKHFSLGPAPEYSRDSWFQKKHILGLDFPNLPYYIDETVNLTHTRAILRYLGRKHGLDGSTEQEWSRVDVVAEQCAEFSTNFVRLCYSPKFKKMVGEYKKELPMRLKQFEKFLGDKPWFAGEKLTWVDFPLYETIDQHLVLESSCLNDFPHLRSHHDRLEALPPIKAYMESDEFLKAPLNNKMAVFK